MKRPQYPQGAMPTQNKPGHLQRTLKNKDDLWEEGLIAEEVKTSVYKNIMPNFRSVTPVFPKLTLMNQAFFPIGLVISPGDFSQVPLIDVRKKYIPKCYGCGAYINLCCKINKENQTALCPVCGHSITLPEDMNTDEEVRFKAPVYDMIESGTENEEHLQNYIFIIDTSKKAVDSGFTRDFCQGLINFVKNASDISRFGIFTYDETLQYYDSLQNRVIEVADLEDFQFPALKLRNISENREWMINSLEKISQTTGKVTEANCFPSALLAADKVFGQIGGVIIASLYGNPTNCPHSIEKPHVPQYDSDPLIFHHSIGSDFYLETGKYFNEHGLSLNLVACTDGNDNMHLIGLIPGLSSGSMKLLPYYKPEFKQQINSYLTKISLTPYFYKAYAKLILNPDLFSIDHVSSNGVYSESSEVSLGNFPYSSTLVYDLTMRQDIQSNSLFFQHVMKYKDAFGLNRIRVTTQWFPVSDNTDAVRQNLDAGAFINYLTRVYANSLLGAPYRKAITVIKSTGDPLINSINEFLTSSEITQQKHSKGADGRTEDIIYIRNSNVFDLLLYFYPRIRYFGPNKCVRAVQNTDDIFMYVKKDADTAYLQKAFGVDEIQKLPENLPIVDSPENVELWGYVRRYIHVCRANIIVE